ncbi:MAG: CAF17-like 4Fe-4S cluster assembly/insertion protein YgfZ [Bauldia sp.]
MAPVWTDLPDRGVVEVLGPDARPFLHNLLTTDVARIVPGAAGYGGLLTPQGKILFDFIVHDAGGDRFLLDVARDRASDLAKRLGFYKLRAAITIADRSDAVRVVAAWEGGPSLPAGSIVAPDPRLAELGIRAVVPAGAAMPEAGRASPSAYRAHRLALGVPEGGVDFTFGDAFPHDADMDQLGGVDFAKGCYTGQEIVARMEHRGTARRRIIRVSADAPLPPPGTPILANDIEIGTLGSTEGATGLAMLRLDRAADAMRTGQPITAGGVAITLSLPAWARFTWPEAAAS